jgi:hypothetical protein
VTAASAVTSTPPQLFRRPDALLAFVAGSVSIGLVYYVLLLRETTFHRVAAADASRPAYGIAVATLAFAACLLFGANLAAVNVLARARAGGRVSIAAGVGGLAGAFGAGCPTCGAFLLSVIGVSGGLSVLPLAGIELWAGACLVMALSAWSAVRRLRTCRDQDCLRLPPPSGLHMAVLGAIALASTLTLTALIASNG